MKFPILAAMAGLCGVLACLPGQAADSVSAPRRMLKSEYRIARAKLYDDYRAARAVCAVKPGSQERACSKDAEAAYDKAEEDLRAAFYAPH